MKKIACYIIALLFLAILSYNYVEKNLSQKISKVQFKSAAFLIEEVYGLKERQLGLSFRESLNIQDGMLFKYDADQISEFWMKDMNFPLDIIFINSQFKVTEIAENLQPCSNICEVYTPKIPYKFALEINASLSEKYDIRIGDSATFLH